VNTTVITVDEADDYLAQKAAWLELSDAVKTSHIVKGSVYAQTQWTCVDDVVWEGTPDIPDELKEAVAYYAYADSQGVLYGDPSSPVDRHGGLREVTSRVGELSDSVAYFQGGTQSGSGNMSVTGYADALMRTNCSLVSSSSSVGLVRV